MRFSDWSADGGSSDRVDDIEEAPAGTVADAGAGDGDGEVGLAGAGATGQHDVALMGEEVAAGELVRQGLVDRRAVEGEVFDGFGQRQLGPGDLVGRMSVGEGKGG